MKIHGIIVVMGLMLSCGSSSKPGAGSIPQEQACPMASQAACAKLFSCTGDIVLGLAQAALGGTTTACEMMIQQSYCAPFLCSAADYRADKAGECKTQFNDVTCAQLSAAAVGAAGTGGVQAAVMAVLATAPSCLMVCPVTDAAASGA